VPLIELGHQYDVPVFACLGLSGLVCVAPRAREETQPPAAWNGAWIPGPVFDVVAGRLPGAFVLTKRGFVVVTVRLRR